MLAMIKTMAKAAGLFALAMIMAISACATAKTAAEPSAGGLMIAQGAFTPPASQPPPKPAFGQPTPQSVSQSPNFMTRFWMWVQTTQADLSRELVKAVRGLKTENAVAAGALLALFSFIYGVVHAVGPGHGKAIISSYVLANERTVRRGIMLAFLSSLVQALSAIAIVIVFSVIMRAAGLRIQEAVGQLETASYALVALIGAWMLISAVRARWPFSTAKSASGPHSLSAAAPQPARGAAPYTHPESDYHAHHHHHHHDHSADCGCGHSHVPSPSQISGDLPWRKAAAIIFAVGIRPCTGAILVLVFALTQGLFWAGVASTFAMALGTAITVSALAVMAVGSRDLAVRLSGGSGAWAARIETVAAIGGSLFILLTGLALFFGSLGPARPFVF